MNPNPTFAQLVYRFLPESDWLVRYRYARKNQSGQLIPHPETSILDRYHYEQLKLVEECDDGKLERAWEQWLEWGTYLHGESQRVALYITGKAWANHWQNWKLLRPWLRGSFIQRQDFKERWIMQAHKEMQENENWEMWAQFLTMANGEIPDERTRIISSCTDSDGFVERDPDDYLGEQLYLLEEF